MSAPFLSDMDVSVKKFVWFIVVVKILFIPLWDCISVLLSSPLTQVVHFRVMTKQGVYFLFFPGFFRFGFAFAHPVFF